MRRRSSFGIPNAATRCQSPRVSKGDIDNAGYRDTGILSDYYPICMRGEVADINDVGCIALAYARALSPGFRLRNFGYAVHAPLLTQYPKRAEHAITALAPRVAKRNVGNAPTRTGACETPDVMDACFTRSIR